MSTRSSDLYTTLYPIERVLFARGESPSPSKLNGIFNYMHVAFYVLEKILGNASDFNMANVEDLSERRQINNLAQMIGSTEKIYKPINKFIYLENLWKKYINTSGDLSGDIASLTGSIDRSLILGHSYYNRGNSPVRMLNPYGATSFYSKFQDKFGLVEFLNIKNSFLIPLEQDNRMSFKIANDDLIIRLVYRARYGATGDVLPLDGPRNSIRLYSNNTYDSNGEISILSSLDIPWTLPTENMSILHYNIPKSGLTSFIKSMEVFFNPSVTDNSLKIYSIDFFSRVDAYGNVCESPNDYDSYNTVCGIPLDNQNFWKVAKRCLNADTCNLSTGPYCIGNTYDIYVKNGLYNPAGNNNGLELSPENDLAYKGSPVCGGSCAPGTVPSYLIPAGAIQYSPDTNAKYFTFQSCLLMTSKPFMIKYAPFAIYDPNRITISEFNSILPFAQNTIGVYSKNETNPFLRQVVIYPSVRIRDGQNPIVRPDILKIVDSTGKVVLPDEGDNSSYFLVGGHYSMAEMNSDTLQIIADLARPTALYSE